MQELDECRTPDDTSVAGKKVGISRPMSAPVRASAMDSMQAHPSSRAIGENFQPRKVEHASSRAARRGPMDEMRQLCRILVRIIPQSERFFGESGTEAPAGGGNKMTENEIKEYIRVALGEAPQPTWALPEGWGQYLAGVASFLHIASYILYHLYVSMVLGALVVHVKVQSALRNSFNWSCQTG